MLETIDGGQLARLIICRTGAEKGEGPEGPEGPLWPLAPAPAGTAGTAGPMGPMAWWFHSWWLQLHCPQSLQSLQSLQSSFIPANVPEVCKESCHLPLPCVECFEPWLRCAVALLPNLLLSSRG